MHSSWSKSEKKLTNWGKSCKEPVGSSGAGTLNVLYTGRRRAWGLFSLETTWVDLGVVFHQLKESYRKGRTRFFSTVHRESTRGKGHML